MPGSLLLVGVQNLKHINFHDFVFLIKQNLDKIYDLLSLDPEKYFYIPKD